MSRNEFFQKLVAAVQDIDADLVNRAYWLSKEVHRGQRRDNGKERYFEHCRRVACTLIERGDTSTGEIIVALLHDCIEDGFLPPHLIEVLFGKDVADAVGTLSKVIPVFDSMTGAVQEKQKKDLAEYYRAIAVSSALVRRVKLADRLDNLGDMEAWSPERKRKYLVETETYILPIARATDEQFAKEIEEQLDALRKNLSGAT